MAFDDFDRIQTKDNLRKINMLSNDSFLYPLCNQAEEITISLVFSCRFANTRNHLKKKTFDCFFYYFFYFNKHIKFNIIILR